MRQTCIGLLLALIATVLPIYAAPTPVIRTAQGANNAAIASTVNLFFSDLGGVNNGIGSSFITGRRDLNWDSVSDDFSEPNVFTGSYFKDVVPKGAQMFSTCTGSELGVSADSSNPTNTPVRFGNIDPSYPAIFATFNSQKLLAMKAVSLGNAGCSSFRISFTIPGTDVPATVSGLGVVFSDADSFAEIRLFDSKGQRIGPRFGAGTLNAGLSFLGVTFSTGERIASAEIWPGPLAALAPGGSDGTTPGTDRVSVAAIFYGEPRAATFHSGDFDGDGSADSAIFRPANAQWFTLNSGSNTFSVEQWGANGDIPVDGDFDGDSRADLCIYRPSNGQWWLKRSSNNSTFAATFGQSGDKPVVGDYDGDGKSDIALWRPSTGNYFVLRSSTNFSTFYAYPFGQNGDIPVQGGAQ